MARYTPNEPNGAAEVKDTASGGTCCATMDSPGSPSSPQGGTFSDVDLAGPPADRLCFMCGGHSFPQGLVPACNCPTCSDLLIHPQCLTKRRNAMGVGCPRACMCRMGTVRTHRQLTPNMGSSEAMIAALAKRDRRLSSDTSQLRLPVDASPRRRASIVVSAGRNMPQPTRPSTNQQPPPLTGSASADMAQTTRRKSCTSIGMGVPVGILTGNMSPQRKSATVGRLLPSVPGSPGDASSRPSTPPTWGQSPRPVKRASSLLEVEAESTLSLVPLSAPQGQRRLSDTRSAEDFYSAPAASANSRTTSRTPSPNQLRTLNDTQSPYGDKSESEREESRSQSRSQSQIGLDGVDEGHRELRHKSVAELREIICHLETQLYAQSSILIGCLQTHEQLSSESQRLLITAHQVCFDTVRHLVPAPNSARLRTRASM